jgi:hypothetical protein
MQISLKMAGQEIASTLHTIKLGVRKKLTRTKTLHSLEEAKTSIHTLSTTLRQHQCSHRMTDMVRCTTA